MAPYSPYSTPHPTPAPKGFLARVPAHARVVAGGAPLPGPGFFIAPTVVAGLRQDDELVQQEVRSTVHAHTTPTPRLHHDHTTPTPRPCHAHATPTPRRAQVFGPVITVQPFADEAQAVAMANGVEYGLASSVRTKGVAAH